MTDRRWSIDLLRIAAAFGVVYYHSFAALGHRAAFAGLIALIVLSAYFAARRPADRWTVKETARRLMGPWAVWFAIYAVLNLALHRPVMPPGLSGILISSSIHLWYLPWAFICVLLTRTTRAQVSLATCGYVATGLGILLAASAPWWHPVVAALGAPWVGYVIAAAPFCWGIVLAQPPSRRRTVEIGALLLSLVDMGFCVGSEYTLPYAIGFLACLAACAGDVPRLPRWAGVTRLARATYGVYLSHILVFWALKQLVLLPAPQLAVATFLVAALGSVAYQALTARMVSARLVHRSSRAETPEVPFAPAGAARDA